MDIKLGTGPNNWSEWQILIKQLLVLENCWSVVDPEAADTSTGRTRSDKGQEEDFQAGKNAKALALITTHVEPFHLKTAGTATSARGLWQQFEKTRQTRQKLLPGSFSLGNNSSSGWQERNQSPCS